MRVGLSKMGLMPQKRLHRALLSVSAMENIREKTAVWVNQEACPYQTLNLLVPDLWTSQIPELGEINVYCLSHQFMVFLSQQPKQTKVAIL